MAKEKQEKLKKDKKNSTSSKKETSKKVEVKKVDNKKKNVSKKKVEEKKVVEKKNPKLRINRVRRKSTKSYADESKIKFTPEMQNAFWTTLVVLLVLSTFYLISFFATGNSLFNNNAKEPVEIQYEEILVGSSFDMGEKYYVVYYDMSDDENEQSDEIRSSVYNLESYDHDYKVYKCDLGNAFNKSFVTTEEPNRDPHSAEEMLFNGPTIIKFENGSITSYISGYEDVKTFLDGLESARHRDYEEE